MIEGIVARAGQELELARRRHEIAQALAADWGWWSPLLGGATDPAGEREVVAEPPAEAPAPVQEPATAPQGCKRCGGPLSPRRNQGGRPKVFCSTKCSREYHGRAAWEREKARAAARRAPEVELPPEPLPDLEERPFFTKDGPPEDEWLSEQLALPKLPWQREQAPGH